MLSVFAIQFFPTDFPSICTHTHAYKPTYASYPDVRPGNNGATRASHLNSELIFICRKLIEFNFKSDTSKKESRKKKEKYDKQCERPPFHYSMLGTTIDHTFCAIPPNTYAL